MNRLYQLMDNLWGAVSRIVFVRFQFEMPVEQLHEMRRKGRVIFAITNGSMIDWLILSSWSRTQGMGAVLVSNRKIVLWLSKPLLFLQLVFGQKKYADLFLSAEEGPRLIFCPSNERKKLFKPTPVENLLAELYSKGATQGTEFFVVPVFIRWRKYIRGEGRKFHELLLGLSSNPNFIGKVWYLVRRRRDSTVKALTPFPLVQREGKESADIVPDVIEEGEGLKVARYVRRKILVLIHQEMHVVFGPRYLSPTAVKETLMRDPEIQKAILEVAEKEGIGSKKAMMRAYQYLTEIVANYTFRFIEVMLAFLSWLFNRVFDGVVVKNEDLQMVRETMKTKPIVFVSCHRSHLDYLVIPYVLFKEDMVTPHIVAGVNLSFWPLGIFLRMGGAFFIRRSFRGNALYTICLRKYVEYLLNHRHNIKFFIEGTRSRSGKMLPPTYGILKMVMETYRSKNVEDFALIPVSLCYDEVFEEGSYTKELQGAQKKEESAKALIQSGKIIKQNIGKVYVRFAPPLSVKDVYQSAEESGLDATLMLQKTAFQISKSINDVSPITPKSIVSSILLTHRMVAIPLEDILRIAERMGRYVLHANLSLSVAMDDGFRRAIEQTVRKLHKSNLVSVSENVPRGYACEEKRRVVLNFYKNNAIHCLVTPSIALLAFFDTLKNVPRFPTGTLFYDEYVRSAVRVRNLLKFEFFFSPTPVFVNELRNTLTYFGGDRKWEEETAETWLSAMATHFTDWNEASVYLALVGDLLESYLTAAAMLREHEGMVFEKKSLLSKMVKYGEHLISDGKIQFPESNSIQNYSNALMLFENQKYLSIDKSEGKIAYQILSWNMEMEGLSHQLNAYLDLMKDNPENFMHPELRKYFN